MSPVKKERRKEGMPVWGVRAFRDSIIVHVRMSALALAARAGNSSSLHLFSMHSSVLTNGTVGPAPVQLPADLALNSFGETAGYFKGLKNLVSQPQHRQRVKRLSSLLFLKCLYISRSF